MTQPPNVAYQNPAYSEPEKSADDLAAERARSIGTPGALRQYLTDHFGGMNFSSIKEVYDSLASSELEKTLQKSDRDDFSAHLERFPEHKKQINVALSKKAQTEIRAGFRGAKTVRLSFDYLENDQPAKFPEPMKAAMGELLGYAGIQVVEGEDCDTRISVTGKTEIMTRKYSGGLTRRDAIVDYEGKIAFHVSKWPQIVYSAGGHVVNAPGTIAYPEKLEINVTEGGLKPMDAIEDSEHLHVLGTFILSTRGVKPLVRALASTSKNKRGVPPFERYYVADAAEQVLQNYSKTDKVDPLRKLLLDDSANIRARSVRALEKHWQPKRADDELERLNFYLFGSWEPGPLYNIHDFSPASLQQAKAASRGGGESQERAIMLLSALGRPGLDALMEIQMIEAAKPTTLKRALTQVGEPARKRLLPLMRHQNPYLRREILASLLFMGSAEAIEYAHSIYGSLGPPELQAAEARLSVTRLLQKLTNENYNIRASAARHLGATGDPRALAPLLNALEDEAEQVITAVARALGWYGDRRAIAALENEIANGKRNTIYQMEINRIFHQAMNRILAYGRPQ